MYQLDSYAFEKPNHFRFPALFRIMTRAMYCVILNNMADIGNSCLLLLSQFDGELRIGITLTMEVLWIGTFFVVFLALFKFAICVRSHPMACSIVARTERLLM